MLDIGANIGVYTKFLSDMVGEQGRVTSFEPVPTTFDILSSNIQRLNLKNVRLFNVAVSDQNKMVKMEVPVYKTGGENFYESRIVEQVSSDSFRCVEVQSRSLDSLCSEFIQKISFVKCDVEGFEYHCLTGAAQFIRDHSPVWLMEISSDPDDDRTLAHKTFGLLAEAGYEPFLFDGKIFRKRQRGDKTVNYFFLHRNHVHKLKNIKFYTGDDRS
ncbi:MAG: hypothetical protein A2Z81_08655 [Omnitrophica WOR_2 bacterium GWA2_45_18]|nr:MAG: hypothetical protein A2Z81_08655 [Omnitrophica WOR_2 bacterium GWA2_45_18]